MKVIKSFLQGFLPGLALKIFMHILPAVLMMMSKIEGYLAISVLERKSAAKYYYFMLVNVFLGSIITGTAFEQLHPFLHQSPTQIPRTIGVSIPMKATFFITYIMVDGWAGIASEILRLKPLVIYHLKNMFLVKTERDREKAMDPGSVALPETLPTFQLYFLLGLVYAVVTPILLPFILVFFGFAYLVYRHQIDSEYSKVKFKDLYEGVTAMLVYPNYLLSNIMTLLFTGNLELSVTTAAALVNVKDGLTSIFGIVGAIVNDVYLINLGMIFFSSLFYLGNQAPNDSEWAVLFTMDMGVLGIVLFALLIGNMQNFLQALGRRPLGDPAYLSSKVVIKIH